MKKLINDADSYLLQGLRGFGRAHADLVRVDLDQRIIVRLDAPRPGKVGLISGGGSGHEPLHGGFVGLGMLDAACPGEVFTSPPPDPIVAATQAVDAGAGVVHIVKNYTGDVMNFQIAAELASDEGITVESILVDDDVAVQDSLYTAGRRGTGATVLVEKIAGACAEAGGSLADVVALGRRVAAESRSFGVALTSCTTPAAGRPTFDIGPDEMEFGVGIHGEPGRRREQIRPASEIVREMTDAILSELNPAGPNLLALVNGLGGTPLGELYLIFDELARILDQQGLTISRSLVGNYVTSLDMAGASITLLTVDDDLLRWWDAPVHTAGLRWGR